ncbi:hypothetical protein NQ317_005542 [Molorchus minor]|uniref:vitamin-K-epoxide reductase (warfarin-sensitive) n=1 Tax=Molorchus minor TaxID=1323400 RepID=A0ABQ9JW41_9CUCU|nr:hypothetical protein NQ317_005542 [Molorchus minor]
MISISLQRINSLLTFSCLVGLGLSLYSYTVEVQVELNKDYQPLCDINSHVSCTKAFKSEYGKGFGIFDKQSILYKPNSLFGIMFYSMLGTLALSNSNFVTLLSMISIAVSNIMSLYFAYILYFILKDLCIVCVSIYVVNVANLILIHLKMKTLKTIEEQEKNK